MNEKNFNEEKGKKQKFCDSLKFRVYLLMQFRILMYLIFHCEIYMDGYIVVDLLSCRYYKLSEHFNVITEWGNCWEIAVMNEKICLSFWEN